jgi:hypothetical protein
MLLETLHEWGMIEHYLLTEICSYGILIAVIAWGAWRAYVGMERDGDFYDGPWFQ